jgi:hypothetical protein
MIVNIQNNFKKEITSFRKNYQLLKSDKILFMLDRKPY